MILIINAATAESPRSSISASLAAASVERRSHLRIWLCVGAGLLGISESGCVSRRLMVQSNPPGAMVLAEGREIGYTPTAVDFTYYGTRELTFIKDGYETTSRMVPVRAPWYQWPGVDFFSDNLLPFRVTDRQSIAIDLQPKLMVPNQELLNRGRELRGESQIAP